MDGPKTAAVLCKKYHFVWLKRANMTIAKLMAVVWIVSGVKMKIELLNFNEETGECQLDIDEEGKQFLIEQGFNAIIMKALVEIEKGE